VERLPPSAEGIRAAARKLREVGEASSPPTAEG
jgi:hypothetical protein